MSSEKPSMSFFGCVNIREGSTSRRLSSISRDGCGRDVDTENFANLENIVRSWPDTIVPNGRAWNGRHPALDLTASCRVLLQIICCIFCADISSNANTDSTTFSDRHYRQSVGSELLCFEVDTVSFYFSFHFRIFRISN